MNFLKLLWREYFDYYKLTNERIAAVKEMLQFHDETGTAVQKYLNELNIGLGGVWFYSFLDEEMPEVSIYYKTENNTDLEVWIKEPWLHLQPICVAGIIGCYDGKTCTLDHK
jgi:hypothetical protein